MTMHYVNGCYNCPCYQRDNGNNSNTCGLDDRIEMPDTRGDPRSDYARAPCVSCNHISSEVLEQVKAFTPAKCPLRSDATVIIFKE